MNCTQFQRRLLGTETPDRPADEVEAHLVACPACRDWQRRLLQLEANVARIPVPPSSARSDLIRRILGAPATMPVAPVTSPRRPWSWRWVAGGAVAAAVLVACGIFLGNALWQAVGEPGDRHRAKTVARNKGSESDQGAARKEGRKAPADTLVARLVRCDLRLARASSPRERVEALAELADSLHGETPTLARAASTAALDRLARLYGKVVREGVVPRSRAVPAGERHKVLAPIAAQLARAERAALKLARQTPASARPLRLIAAAAREGKTRLRGLMEKDT